MDEARRLTGSPASGPALRPWIVAAVLILLAWNGFQAWRMTLPMRQGHDAFISRQIGRTGLNHRILGVQTTRLANVTAIRQDGGLVLHRSYGPMASWVVALSMATGLPYDPAVRLPALISMNLFLIGTGLLAWRLGGSRASLAAMIVAALAPVVLFRYSLLCVFENLGLGPFMLAMGIGLQPESRKRSIAVGALATLAVFFPGFSWPCWFPGWAGTRSDAGEPGPPPWSWRRWRFLSLFTWPHSRPSQETAWATSVPSSGTSGSDPRGRPCGRTTPPL